MALLVKPNPRLVCEKRARSLEGGLDPCLLRRLPLVVVKAAKKSWRQSSNMAEMLFTSLADKSPC